MKNLIVRTITGIFFVVAVVVCFLRPVAMEFLFALVTGLSLWEYCGLVNTVKGVSVNRFISTIAGVYFFLAVGGFCSGVVPTGAVFIPYLLTIVYLFISELYTKADNAINNWAHTMLGQMYIALPFSTINVLAFNATPDGGIVYNYIVPLCVFIFLWANDTGAYCSGSLFIVLAVAYLIGWYNNSHTPEATLTTLQWMGLGLVVVVFGTWGDLVESLFKRTLGIKDSGNILPGHGGMLDRFDSSLMAMPAAVIYLFSLTLF